MADVNISKYTTQVVREGSKPASPGFVVSEGQDPVNPSGTNNYVPYSGATANVELGEFGLETGFVTLDTTPTNIPTEQGGIYWDVDNETVDVILNGTIMQIGQDLFYPVKNQTGSTIPKGTAVRFAGTVGASGRLLIAPFIANNTVPSSRFMGVTSEAILDGADGKVMWFGRIRGINTNSFNEGDILYASTTTAGAFQTTIPVAPNNIVQVAAVVTKSINQGAIFVRPTIGSNINKDEGVKITSVANLDLLQYQSGTGLWENKTLAQVIGSAYVPSTRTITINGTTQDLSANRTYNVGTVTAVTASSPLFSSGGATPNITIQQASGSQSGFLSSTDWTTFNGKQNALTNPVTGTGTSGQVAYFTGTSAISSESNLFWDATNDRLGIGTASPQQKIHAQGTGATTIIAERTGASAAIVGLYASQNPAIIWGTSSDFLRFAQIDDTALGGFIERWRITTTGVFQSNGAQTIQTSTGALTIQPTGGVNLATSSGNVGIGTATPNTKLEVVGNSFISDGLAVGVSRNFVNSGPILTISLTNGGSGYVDGTYVDVPVVNGASVYARFTIVVSGGIVTTATLIWGGSSYRVGETLSILNTSIGGSGSGLVITVLSVDSSKLIIVDNNGGDITLYRNDTSLTAADNIGSIKFEGRDSTLKASGIYAKIGAFARGANGGAFLSFFTSLGSGGLLTEQWRITTSGNLQSQGAQTIETSTGALTLQPSNNVLIGTTTDAGFKLDVNGTGRFSGTLTGNYGAIFSIPSESPATGNTALTARTSNGANDIFRWFDGSTTLGVFKNNGNVLIGTTTDNGSRLRVNGSIALPHTTKSANYTLDETDYTVGFDCASNRTATLPDATACAGRIYVIYQYNTGSGTRSVTLDGNGSQTINGVTTYSLAPYCDFTSVVIQSNGSNWIIISSNLTVDCL